jgi:hypothetical protein
MEFLTGLFLSGWGEDFGPVSFYAVTWQVLPASG